MGLPGYSRVGAAARLGRFSRLPSLLSLYECRGAAPACHALQLPWDMSVYAKCVGLVALAKAHHLLQHSSVQYAAVLKGYGAPCQCAVSLPVFVTFD